MNKTWTAAQDRALLDAVKRSGGVRAAARDLGISENAAIGRLHRFRGTVFPCDLRTAEERKALDAKRHAEQVEIMATMQMRIDRGVPRDVAIKMARKSGATYAAIGHHFGFSWQRAQQLATEVTRVRIRR